MSEIQFGRVRPSLRFYRSNKGYLAGVCKGLADSFGWDPLFIRLIWLGALFFYGVGLLMYLILAVSLPRQDELHKAFDRRVLGVCGKISQKMRWEVGLVRAAAIFLAFASIGFAVLAYLVLHFSFDEERTSS